MLEPGTLVTLGALRGMGCLLAMILMVAGVASPANATPAPSPGIPAEAPTPAPRPGIPAEAPGARPLPDMAEGTHVLGRSVEGRPIECVRMGTGRDVVLFMAAFHGDEGEGVPLLRAFRAWLAAHPALLEDRTVLLVPVVNPDGLARGTRTNARDVDVNRNFPARSWKRTPRIPRNWCGPAPASEPETRVVMELVGRAAPARIVSIHTPLAEVNFDGPAEELAEIMALCNQYPATADIGYPTPGSFGTWAGRERRIPTITLELGPGSDEKLWEENREALRAALRYSGPARDANPGEASE